MTDPVSPERLDELIQSATEWELSPDELDHIASALRELKELRERCERMEKALNPRAWDRAMSDAWHRAIPDTQKAFLDLRDAAMQPSSAAGSKE